MCAEYFQYVLLARRAFPLLAAVHTQIPPCHLSQPQLINHGTTAQPTLHAPSLPQLLSLPNHSTQQQTTGVPNLIADMNTYDLKFTVFDGDLKQGSNSPCDEALYNRSLGYFNSMRAPSIYTPGERD